MPKIRFPLSSKHLGGGRRTQRLVASRISPNSVGRVNTSGGRISPRMAKPLTVDTPTAPPPLIDPRVVDQGARALMNSAAQFQERKDRAYAQDAFLRAKQESGLLWFDVDEKGQNSGFSALKGKAVVDDHDRFVQKTEEVYSGYSKGLNPNANQKYLAMINAQRDSDLDRAARHLVKNQNIFEEQLRNASWGTLADVIDESPEAIFVPQSDGVSLLQKTIGGDPNLERRTQRAGEIARSAIDLQIARTGSIEAGVTLFSDYAEQIPPEARVSIEQHLFAKRAALKKSFKANKTQIQNDLVGAKHAELPDELGAILLSSVLPEKDITDRYTDFLTLHPDDDKDLAADRFSDALKDAFQVVAAKEGADYVSEKWSMILSRMEEAGTPVDISIQSQAIRALEGLQAAEEKTRSKARAMARGEVYDSFPDAISQGIPVSQLPGYEKLRGEDKVTVTSAYKKMVKAQDLSVPTTKKYTHNVDKIQRKFLKGEDVDLQQSFEAGDIDYARKQGLEAFRDDPFFNHPTVKSTRRELNTLIDQGIFDTKKRLEGVDLRAHRAGIAIEKQQELSDWLKDNSDKPSGVRDWLVKQQTEALENRGGVSLLEWLREWTHPDQGDLAAEDNPTQRIAKNLRPVIDPGFLRMFESNSRFGLLTELLDMKPGYKEGMMRMSSEELETMLDKYEEAKKQRGSSE